MRMCFVVIKIMICLPVTSSFFFFFVFVCFVVRLYCLFVRFILEHFWHLVKYSWHWSFYTFQYTKCTASAWKYHPPSNRNHYFSTFNWWMWMWIKQTQIENEFQLHNFKNKSFSAPLQYWTITGICPKKSMLFDIQFKQIDVVKIEAFLIRYTTL